MKLVTTIIMPSSLIAFVISLLSTPCPALCEVLYMCKKNYQNQKRMENLAAYPFNVIWGKGHLRLFRAMVFNWDNFILKGTFEMSGDIFVGTTRGGRFY